MRQIVSARAIARGLAQFSLAFVLALATANCLTAQDKKLRDAGPTLDNVAAALENLPAEGRGVKFSRGAFALASSGHLQGIQIAHDKSQDRTIALLSHDSDAIAYLLIVALAKDPAGEGKLIHVHSFPSDGQQPPLRHVGGIQLAGDVLAVGLEDNQQKTRSEVQFWDMRDPEKPAQLEHLTVRRHGEPKDKTAGAVGLASRERGHVLAVANWDSRAIDFYLTNGKPLDDPACRFEFHKRFRVDTAATEGWRPNRDFGTYQAINLAADARGQLFLFGFDTSRTGQDYVDLFALDLAAAPSKLLRKQLHKPIKLQATNRFRYGAGLSIARNRLTILSTPYDVAGETVINVVE